MKNVGLWLVSTGLAIALSGPAASSAAPPSEQEPDRSSPTADFTSFRMSGDQILVDKFDIKHQLRGNELTLALQTDLGDSTKVDVTVSRYYKPPGHHNRYPVHYFKESSTVGAWRDQRVIELDQDAWERELAERRQVLAALERPMTESFVADDIEIRFLVPVEQSPPFEARNSNLSGAAVLVLENYRVILRRITMQFAIDSVHGDAGPESPK